LQPTRTAKDVEFEALARITRSLQSAASKGNEGFPELASALHRNRKLWDIFAIDVATPENRMEKELRARIFYLAEFTRRHTSEVLARRASVMPLIEINTAIMRGLRSKGT
jgi:flagellar protein FlaF